MQLRLQGLLGCMTNAVNDNVWLILKARKNTVSISQMNFLYRTLMTMREIGKFSLLFRQTCRLNTCMFKSFSWEKFGKFWNKLSRCAKILINQQNMSTFLRCACLRKTDNQFYVALQQAYYQNFCTSNCFLQTKNLLFFEFQ